MHLLVGWWPGEADTLMVDLPTLVPAVLYADKVTVLCPESDDFLEMRDYSDLGRRDHDVLIDVLSLDQGAWQPDGSVRPAIPEVWEALVERYADQGRRALASGDVRAAGEALAFLQACERRDFPTREHYLPLVKRAEIRDSQPDIHESLDATLLAGYFVAMAAEPGTYALLDDRVGILRAAASVHGWDEWTVVRAREASLSTNVLGRLPSPRANSWDAIEAARSGLEAPRARFRTAIAKLAATTAAEPLDAEFEQHAEHVWRTEVLPAVMELEDLVRQASLREIFFTDVLGDLKTYAGPALGFAAALTGGLSTAASAAVAAAPAAGSVLATIREKRRPVQGHDYFFLREAEKRLA